MPYYAYLQEHVVDGVQEPVLQRYYLVTAANAIAASDFFVGLGKYAETKNGRVYSTTAETMEWWNCTVRSAGDIRWIYNEIMAHRPENYNNVEELADCRGKIILCELNITNWPIIPVTQNTSLDYRDHQI
ncbi:hypothetical protein AtubIFM55763_005334 [Aspergillus tubingensis]|uniref:Uncharacterized protein n=2 Tax=Aspergillus subgen. Circumdati TaxID=2720871 RepID=A0A1L9NCX3_ASPTC|nr:hypothetical protein BO79DRAFT_135863 [Aspergillus costaricaensis CBS 115574]XP_035356239.1 TatD related DNase family protein [Aspergillus tubingensis]OJI87133.1 hypothetical protein ASPTUDRAFT_40260 [Aspergillus tubingensis CBS 134.48]RAK93936.1 hypothetical protein BO79DRAFT_135863 [Aspergillus costaricaensis CBS 115574]GFN15435.1 TatD related DNase family protein [Aspergillus tubingensis]GLA68593.1 hypothetical protein AtubIFM55763_005334 [Aspergillus tubingensis]GLA98650.1 hypothetical